MRGRLAAPVAFLAVAIGLSAAPAAEATFHLMQIREVYPGSVASPGSEYVELQMWAEGQNDVAGHVLRTYAASGAVTGTDAFSADVPRGADQSTMVLATPKPNRSSASSVTPRSHPRARSTPAAAPSAGKTSTASLGAPSPARFPVRPPPPPAFPMEWRFAAPSRPAAQPCWSRVTTTTTAPPISPPPSLVRDRTRSPPPSTPAVPHLKRPGPSRTGMRRRRP